MTATDTIRNRRSIRRFTDRPVSRGEIETVLAAAALAPVHRLTYPWRFHVLGPDARQAFGRALGDRKAKKLDDAERAEALRNTVAAEHRALPAMLAVSVVPSDDAEIAEENYAAAMMAIQNLALAAVELGLGTHIKTGAIMASEPARAAIGVADGERVIAIVNLGEPAEVPPPKDRPTADALTRWLP